MKAINITNLKLKSLTAAFVLAILLGLAGSAVPVFAHGGEDHGDTKPAVASNQKGMVTRTARADEFEILLKHSALEPDTATAAKLFITNFNTNAPLADAKPSIEITAQDGKTYEASEIKADAPGSFSFTLPALPEGSYTVLAKFSPAGKTDTATFSGVSVEHSEAESAASSGSWLQALLMAAAAAVILALFGGLLFYAFRILGGKQIVSEETVSA